MLQNQKMISFELTSSCEVKHSFKLLALNDTIRTTL